MKFYLSASVKINGSEISYGRSNKIFIDGHSELKIAGTKFENTDEVVNAHKKIQLRSDFIIASEIPLFSRAQNLFRNPESGFLSMRLFIKASKKP